MFVFQSNEELDKRFYITNTLTGPISGRLTYKSLYVSGNIAANFIKPENYGTIDGSNDSTYVQMALDAAEGGGTVLFDGSKTYHLKKTVYVGRVNLAVTNGTEIVFQIDDDGTFATSGSGALKSVGAILTKSGQNAGYGLTTVSIFSAPIRIIFNKSSNIVSGPLLIENTDFFVVPNLTVIVTNTSGTNCNTLDFYQGVQHVDIEILTINGDIGGSTIQGGFWIRNKSAARDTAFIDIAVLNITHKGTDEAIAIFNDVNNGDVHDIHIGQANITIVNGGHGLACSIYNAGTYSSTMFANILIDNLMIDVNGFTANTPFVLKTSACAPTLTTTLINLNSSDAGSLGTNAWIYRHIPGTNQLNSPNVDSLTINVNANISVSSASYVVDGGGPIGALNINTLNINGTGTGWTNDLHNVGIIYNGTINHNVTGVRVSGAKSLESNVSVYGRIQDCFNFIGSQLIDTSIDAGIAYSISSTANVIAYGAANVNYRPILLSVTSNVSNIPLARVFISQTNIANTPCYTNYELLSNLTVTSPDSVSNKSFMAGRNAVKNANGSKTRINTGGTGTLSNDTITLTSTQFEVAINTESGAATDNLVRISPATFDGAVKLMWASNIARVVTIKHQANNINLIAGIDKTLDANNILISNVSAFRWNVNTLLWNEVTNGGL